MLKAQKSGNFYNLSFFNSSDFDFGSNNFFACFGSCFAPWIPIRGSTYLCGFGSGSSKPKS